MKILFQRREFTTCLLFLMLLPGLPARSFCQTVIDKFFVTNFLVRSLAVKGNTIYLGGEFTKVGPPTGGLAKLDPVTGIVDLAFPRVTGAVYGIEPDGSGGWFIGGEFSHVGGVPRSCLAHIKPDNSVDSTWNPSAGGSRPYVYAIKVSGSTVYVGGNFSNIGGAPRNNIAAVDAYTGELTAWNPNANSTVRALAVSAQKVFAGGFFDSIGGESRSSIAALDTSMGYATSWNPNAIDTDYPSVLALTVAGNNVYVGGDFISIGGQPRNNIAAIQIDTGKATNWNPDANRYVNAITALGSTIYVGGEFDTLGGQPRNFIAAFDTSSATPTAWNPNASHTVDAITVSDSTVYVGGIFNFIGGAAIGGAAALDISTGNARSWNPRGGAVQAIGVSSSAVYLGQAFQSMNTVTRYGIAAFDAATGRVTDWNPNANNVVQALAVSDSTLYVGGLFSSIAGTTRNGLAAFDIATGNLTSWNPNVGSSDPFVYTIAVAGSTIYAGGIFTTIGGVTRNRIAAIDAVTGTITSWDPNSNGQVFALAVYGSTVYAGGAFTNIGGQPRNYIAALDASSGNATAWNANANNWLRALAATGSAVYAGGDFTIIGGTTRNHIAALDPMTGNATNWNPNANASVYALAVSAAGVYAGGYFTTIGGAARFGLGALDASTGSATSWDAKLDAYAFALAVDATNTRIYAGGSFRSALNDPRSYFVGLTLGPPDGVNELEIVPKEFKLFQNYPNPFNPSTTIEYELLHEAQVNLKIYNLLGETVASLVNEEQTSGRYRVEWKPTNLSSGIYLCRINAGDFMAVRKLLLIR